VLRAARGGVDMLPAAMRSRSASLVLALVALALVAGCGGSKRKAGTTAATSTAASSGPCRKVAQPAPKGPQHLPKPTLKLDPARTWTATMTTNCGAFTIALDVRHAPKTTASFASLAKRGFYDQLVFHRIAPGFVIQGGDPLGNGTGGPGYRVVEPPPSSTRYTHGVVAMAKAGNEPAGASGSQFFVVTAQDAQLPPEYALVGKVVNGLDVVDAIADLPLQTNDPSGSPPVDPVVIESVALRSG
jgi:peptidyl-prolyl cis-trans isomerase B (cyclophilin B)